MFFCFRVEVKLCLRFSGFVWYGKLKKIATQYFKLLMKFHSLKLAWMNFGSFEKLLPTMLWNSMKVDVERSGKFGKLYQLRFSFNLLHVQLKATSACNHTPFATSQQWPVPHLRSCASFRCRTSPHHKSWSFVINETYKQNAGDFVIYFPALLAVIHYIRCVCKPTGRSLSGRRRWEKWEGDDEARRRRSSFNKNGKLFMIISPMANFLA